LASKIVREILFLAILAIDYNNWIPHVFRLIQEARACNDGTFEHMPNVYLSNKSISYIYYNYTYIIYEWYYTIFGSAKLGKQIAC